MTREQAKREIDSLDYYLQNHTDDYGEESHTAMMMAIKALEQQTCEDAISRKAALAETYRDCTYVKSDKDAYEQLQCIRDGINKLPSVQPKPTECEDAVSREDVLMALTGEWTDSTDELIHRFIRRIKKLPPVNHAEKQELCEDVISRQAIEDAIANTIVNGEELGYAVAYDILSDLPPVNPQPKTGHWEWVQYDSNPNIGNWHCSECNRIVCGAITAANPVYAYKYCPDCGAKMFEPQESEVKE